jgi:lysine 2,3-aminomutase
MVRRLWFNPCLEEDVISVGKKRILRQLKVDLKVYDAVSAVFPVLWPDYYLGLIQGNPETHPVARMGTPRVEELQRTKDDLADPVSDRSSRIGRFLVRKHSNRIIVLTTKRCHFYCRFCFRREDSGEKWSEPQEPEWEEIISFVQSHKEISEVILSGGDPLTLSDERLARIMHLLNGIAHLKRIRIHTRAPVHFPDRVTSRLIQALRSDLPLIVVTHFNHPVELTSRVKKSLVMFQDAGMIMKNQSVLLSGVNDCPVILNTLIRRLLAWGIEPYYLHHPDRVGGNMLFRISIERGLMIYQSTDRILEESGFYGNGPESTNNRKKDKFPAYVLDLPDGKGKVPIPDLVETSPGSYIYNHPDGSVSTYQDAVFL